MGLLQKSLCSFDNIYVLLLMRQKSLKNYKMYPLTTSTSYISEKTYISYTPDCSRSCQDEQLNVPVAPIV